MPERHDHWDPGQNVALAPVDRSRMELLGWSKVHRQGVRLGHVRVQRHRSSVINLGTSPKAKDLVKRKWVFRKYEERSTLRREMEQERIHLSLRRKGRAERRSQGIQAVLL